MELPDEEVSGEDVLEYASNVAAGICAFVSTKACPVFHAVLLHEDAPGPLRLRLSSGGVLGLKKYVAMSSAAAVDGHEINPAVVFWDPKGAKLTSDAHPLKIVSERLAAAPTFRHQPETFSVVPRVILIILNDPDGELPMDWFRWVSAMR
jgi:hypothetical protein